MSAARSHAVASGGATVLTAGPSPQTCRHPVNPDGCPSGPGLLARLGMTSQHRDWNGAWLSPPSIAVPRTSPGPVVVAAGRGPYPGPWVFAATFRGPRTRFRGLGVLRQCDRRPEPRSRGPREERTICEKTGPRARARSSRRPTKMGLGTVQFRDRLKVRVVLTCQVQCRVYSCGCCCL